MLVQPALESEPGLPGAQGAGIRQKPKIFVYPPQACAGPRGVRTQSERLCILLCHGPNLVRRAVRQLVCWPSWLVLWGVWLARSPLRPSPVPAGNVRKPKGNCQNHRKTTKDYQIYQNNQKTSKMVLARSPVAKGGPAMRRQCLRSCAPLRDHMPKRDKGASSKNQPPSGLECLCSRLCCRPKASKAAARSLWCTTGSKL